MIMPNIRSQLETVIRTALKQGVGVNQALNTFRDAGGKIRRQTFLNEYRKYGDIPRKSNVIKHVRKDYLPSQSLFTETTGFMKEDHRYTQNIRLRNMETGETFIRKHSLSTPDRLTMRQAESLTAETMGDSFAESLLAIVDITTIELWHKQGGAWR